VNSPARCKITPKIAIWESPAGSPPTARRTDSARGSLNFVQDGDRSLVVCGTVGPWFNHPRDSVLILHGDSEKRHERLLDELSQRHVSAVFGIILERSAKMRVFAFIQDSVVYGAGQRYLIAA